MFVDDLFEKYKGLSVEGYNFNDAIVINTQNKLFLSEDDFKSIREDVGKKFQII